jgi:hypothetical protein
VQRACRAAIPSVADERWLTTNPCCSSFVLVMMHGFPISARLPEDLGFGERFWYWRGFSGQPYIHSIYSRESCPPLPGAIFLVVEVRCGIRTPVAVGRFAELREGDRGILPAARFVADAGEEIHVHLLAREGAAAELVLRDLVQALGVEPRPVAGIYGFFDATRVGPEPALV